MNTFTAAPVFSSNMVLQRDKTVSVFGQGRDGETVTVQIDGIVKTAKVRDGKWLVRLSPHAAAENLTMTVTNGDETLTFYNVAYGEVWLAGGQSNMELELQNCAEKDALQNDKKPNVRFYYTQKKNITEADFYESEKNTGWSEFDSESARCWSAVGYFFARELAENLGVVVGLIGCNWGGTSASYWMSRESLERDSELRIYIDELDRSTEGKTDQQQKKEWEDFVKYNDEWNRKSAEFYKENPNGSWSECQEQCGQCQYPGPLSKYNPMSPSALYRSMIQRVCPYTLKGFIFYQGETDDCKAKYYFRLFRELIQLWRDDWGDDDLPFLFVQLPMHRYKDDVDWKHWCIIREAQMKVYQTVKNTGICIALDKGEFNEIHPKSKLPIGHRLAMQALYQVYGFENLKEHAFSPMYESFEIKDGGIKLFFKHCYGFKTEGEVTGFEIAGEDKEFKPAVPQFDGTNIFISSDKVKEPLYARYNWTNYGPVTVFGVNGLPLAPFRTDIHDEK